MSRPHRFVNATRRALKEALEHCSDRVVLVGVSGGSDSMALAATLAFVAPKLGILVHAVCVDHGIRPESVQEAAFVRDVLRKRGVPVEVCRVDVDGSSGPEGNAREARYDAIATYARSLGNAAGPAVVFLGHTQNDQAETVLMGFARGSGAKSIAGMPAVGHLPLHRDVPMQRPFLEFTRDELRTVCSELDVPWVDDPSNDLDGPWTCSDGSPLRRSAVRHRILPELQDVLGSGTIGAIARTASMLQADNAALEHYARIELERVCTSRNPITLDCESLKDVPEAVRRRTLKYAVEESGVRGGELVYWHIAGLDKLVTEHINKRGLDLPGVRAWRERNLLRLEPGAQSTSTANTAAQAPMEDT